MITDENSDPSTWSMDDTNGPASLQKGIEGRGRGRNEYQAQRQPRRQEMEIAEKFVAELNCKLNALSTNHSDNSNGRQYRLNHDDDNMSASPSTGGRLRRNAYGEITIIAEPAAAVTRRKPRVHVNRVQTSARQEQQVPEELKANSPDDPKDHLRSPRGLGSSTAASNPAAFPSQVFKQFSAAGSTCSSGSNLSESGDTATTSTAASEEDISTISVADRLEQHNSEKKKDIERRKAEKLVQERKRQASLEPLPLMIPEKIPNAIREQKKVLPIYAVKDQLIDVIKNNQIVIVTGSTGSGKSTQIPQYIAEAGLHGNGRIIVTQPRRMAAKSLATRVAAECGVEIGTTVGYSVKLERSYSDHTIIKFVTDGLLVKECGRDTILSAYSVIIIDEAHERSIHTDLCLGLLKGMAKKRPDIKIIISSATLDEDKFSKFFYNAPIFKVGGTLHPVQTEYREGLESLKVFPEIVRTVFQINREEGRGDILVFLAGQSEIDQVWALIRTRIHREKEKNSQYPTLEIVPCYGGLSFQEQQKIFAATPSNHRKVVLATNIAETSLTIDGIKYVIDTGYFKQTEHDPKSGITALVHRAITKFQAIQRLGRAGRTERGTCYRLYGEDDFNRMVDAPQPEVKRSNLESAVLDILGMGIPNPLEFPFMDPPSEDAIFEALLHLKELGAVNSNFKLIRLGRRLSEFPLTPRLAKVVWESKRLGCEEEVLKIVGLLSVAYQSLFKVKRGSQNDKEWDELMMKVNKIKRGFNSNDGQMLTLLKIYDSWAWAGVGFGEQWCRRNYIQSRILHEAEAMRQELEDILNNRALTKTVADKTDTYPKHLNPIDPVESGAKSESIRKAFTAGYFRQIARKITEDMFETVGNLPYTKDVYMHSPCISLLCSYRDPFVVYHDTSTRTNLRGKKLKTYIGGSIKIKFAWVMEYAPEIARKIRNWDGFFREHERN